MKLSLEETARHLARVRLFAEVDEADLFPLARAVRAETLPSGAVLFLEGDVGDIAYLVVSGSVDLVLESAGGQQILLHTVTAGGYFGEMAILDDMPRSATAIVGEPAQLLKLTRADLLKYLQTYPRAMLHVIRSLSQRVRTADQRVKTLGFFGTAPRLARVLLELDQPHPPGTAITIRHEQLAAMTGSVRQTVSAIVGEWSRGGLIATGRGQIHVLDRQALEAIAE